MDTKINRRRFLQATAVGVSAGSVGLGKRSNNRTKSPHVFTPKLISPVVISDTSGYRYRNGGSYNAVERAFKGIIEGEDTLEALIAGVNIPELDPEESGIGYGGLPNADGVVQLDSCCMHGPKKWAGGVAAIEGIRTPSLIAKSVMELTDHHLLAGSGAQQFARQLGFVIEDDLNTEKSRALWLEWKRRIDPEHFLDPSKRKGFQDSSGDRDEIGARMRSKADEFYRAGLAMVDEGLIEENSFWGTINCNGISPSGDICGVTTTSGLAWKIPGRVGDSPILGAGLYVDGDIGVAGSTGRGEANLYNLTSFLIVENMRHGMTPLDAGMSALKRIEANTVESRLLNSRGLPAFDVRFFILNKKGESAGVAMYGSQQKKYAICTENGSEERDLEGLLAGSPNE
jgi:N4-(beta-N-acetylglucosaminyl)-L-asparaginase|tara:strand:- start:795 stop:1994 length:1200 start_codon:yes stop_codon:yes gene_type:complete